MGLTAQETIDTATREAKSSSATNIDFIMCEPYNTYLPQDSVDCVVANCAHPLLVDEDRRRIIQELHRILRPCGRLAFSDHLALKRAPPDTKSEPEVPAGNAANQVEDSEMEKYLVDIGFDGPQVS
jgi:arsenite methyltransferase